MIGRQKEKGSLTDFLMLIWCLALVAGLFTGKLLLISKAGIAVISYRDSPLFFGFIALLYACAFAWCIRRLWKRFGPKPAAGRDA